MLSTMMRLLIVSAMFMVSATLYASGQAEPVKKTEGGGHDGGAVPGAIATPKPPPPPEDPFKKAVREEVGKTLTRMGKGNLVRYAQELMDKEEVIKLRELDLDTNTKKLKTNETSFAERVKEFNDKTAKILGCMDDTEKNSGKRLSHMVETISAMKPQVAADILSVQEADISVQILDKLDSAKVSKIFNLMNKEISARLQKQYMSMKK